MLVVWALCLTECWLCMQAELQQRLLHPAQRWPCLVASLPCLTCHCGSVTGTAWLLTSANSSAWFRAQVHIHKPRVSVGIERPPGSASAVDVAAGGQCAGLQPPSVQVPHPAAVPGTVSARAVATHHAQVRGSKCMQLQLHSVLPSWVVLSEALASSTGLCSLTRACICCRAASDCAAGRSAHTSRAPRSPVHGLSIHSAHVIVVAWPTCEPGVIQSCWRRLSSADALHARSANILLCLPAGPM